MLLLTTDTLSAYTKQLVPPVLRESLALTGLPGPGNPWNGSHKLQTQTVDGPGPRQDACLVLCSTLLIVFWMRSSCHHLWSEGLDIRGGDKGEVAALKATGVQRE